MCIYCRGPDAREAAAEAAADAERAASADERDADAPGVLGRIVAVLGR